MGDKYFYKSTDGGNVWSNIETNAGYASHFSVYFKDANTGFIGGDGGSFYFTSDGGTTWEPRPAPLTDNLMKEIQFNDPEIFLVGDKDNVFKSTDYGLNWITVNFSSSAPPDNITNSMYSIDKIGNSIVIAGFTGLIYKSADNGNSWTTITSVKNSSYLQGLYVSSQNNKVWVVGDAAPNSVLYSSNRGATWSSDFGGAQSVNFRDVNFLNDNTGFICGENGTVLRTSNSGLNWVSIPTNTEQAANTIGIVDNDVVLVGCNAGKLYRSTNSGLDFTELQIGLNTQQFNSISFPDQNTGWASLSNTILKSTNKGLTWATQYSHSTTLLKVKMMNLNTGFACGYSGSMLKTTNGGVNWTSLSSPITSNLSALDFADLNNGIVVSGGGFGAPGAAMETSNGGTTWSIINTGSNPLFNVKMYHRDSAITVGYANILKYMVSATEFKLNLSVNLELCPVTDTVTVELRSGVSPYNLIATKKGLGGQGVPELFSFTTASNGTPYYIVVKNRNAITTWSSNAVSFSGNVLGYDFTSSVTQAYGDNMRDADGLWSFYQGDINQDGEINLTDILSVFNDASVYLSGSYVLTDLNADGITDLTDIILTSNNSSAFIRVERP